MTGNLRSVTGLGRTWLLPLIACALLGFPLCSQASDEPEPGAVDSDESAEEAEALDLFDEGSEDTEDGWAQLYLAIGVMSLDADGRFAARLPDGREATIIDFERVGLDEHDTSHWVSFNWRSRGSRWGFWGATWQYDVVGARIWEFDPDPDLGIDIPAGALVASDFSAKWYMVEATYSFFRSETIDTGIGFGVHAVQLDTTLLANIEIGDQERTVVSESLDVLAPLPNVLGYLHWKFAPRWTFLGRVGWFGLGYGDFRGKMTNAHGLVSFEMSKRWSASLGYQFVSLDLDVKRERYTQVYDIDFEGPMAVLRFDF